MRGFHKWLNVAVAYPPRYGKKTHPLHVGLGPSHATRACERVSLAMRLAGRPHPSCRSGSPDPDPFVIRRSQTTEGETHIVTMDIAGETRSDARMETSEGPRATIKNASSSRRARACPSPCVWLADRIPPVGQDRLILTCSGSGDPELQRWARCLLVFARHPRRDKYRNGPVLCLFHSIESSQAKKDSKKTA